MNKLTKKDYVNILALISLLLIIILIIKPSGYIYGSTTDWDNQHFAIPEYFRTLFYHTKDILPDFAPNLGAGQNIYNLAYYGLFSPIILISYFFPFIKMVDYIIGSTILILIISVILFYKWLKNKEYSSDICFLTSLAFLCATPLMFHSHRHIMFMNYFYALILGLMGVDSYFKNNKKFLLAFSTFLMVMTSYYYSVGGIVVLGIYGIYLYLKNNNEFKFLGFVKEMLKLVFPILIGILSASILIIPVLATMLSSRSDANIVITLKDLLFPNLSFSFFLYGAYSLGLTGITLISLFYSIKKRKEKKFLSLTLIIITLFPVFNYILNGTLYIDSKSLIPFIPIILLPLASFLKDIFDKKVVYKEILIISLSLFIIILFFQTQYNLLFGIDIFIFLLFFYLFQKFNKKVLVYIPIFIFCLSTALIVNSYDNLVLRKSIKNSTNEKHYELVQNILEEDLDTYRINSLVSPHKNVNKVFDGRYYTTSIYSSLSNMDFNKLYFDIFNNPISYRNKSITNTNNNLLFNMFIGNKYILSNNVPSIGYDIIKEGKINVYKNDNVLPLGYARTSILDFETFNKMEYPYNIEALLKNTIVSKKANNEFVSTIKPIKLEYRKINKENLEIEKKDDIYYINSKKNSKLKLELQQPLKNKTLFIRFKVLEDQTCDIGDSYISINGIQNKLTCSSWKYHNKNFDFDYTLSYPTLEELEIKFTPGLIKISNVEMYVLDYNQIKDIKKDIDALKIDKNKTIGDKIVGDISVKEDGYFNLSIPYDKGFNIKVDGINQKYEKTNTIFIGFPISKGNHHIEIIYEAPFKDISVIISSIGILFLITLLIFDIRKK